MQELLEYLKFLTPIITFGLGIWATPLIESRKEKAKATVVYRNLILEIEDELSELPNRLIKMADTLGNLISFKAGEPKIDRPWKYVPRNTSCYFLKAAIEASFGLFDKNQRYAIKSLFVQIDALGDYLQVINDTKISDDTFDEAINNCKRYLYTGSCMLNTMRIIANKPKANLSGEDKEIINEIFLELGIDLRADDLRTKSTVKFEKIG
ncbi:hypothetical protein [Candidatus Methylobacter oryzae]|uniref:Uncharacterized protein n=1 Tax=Candidatus Methylobacter oryzae TaxID=2497749 RepID=A0ABY3CCY7_9GAMM|nr:hypothetical protein [Candidatus Methylobacter oryzae]TRX00377.1 hypothetical protein EKO24_006165 [Candidatus Methylobacter oryzae]